MDYFINIFIFILLVTAYLFITYKEKKNIKFDFFNVEIIDNKAQWVYKKDLYTADIVDGKVDYSTRKKISLR